MVLGAIKVSSLLVMLTIRHPNQKGSVSGIAGGIFTMVSEDPS